VCFKQLLSTIACSVRPGLYPVCSIAELRPLEPLMSEVGLPYSGKFLYGGNFCIIGMPCEHIKI